MARYRSIQTSFWQDNFVMRLPLMEKTFYNYLLTNTRTSQCGIYSFSIILTSVELSCSEEEVRGLLHKFVDYGKILYDEENEEIMLLNWYKYNLSISRNTLICVNRELQDVKNKEFVRRFYELCKAKKYPLDVIFDGIDIGETLKADESGEKLDRPLDEGTSSERYSVPDDAVRYFNENIHVASPIERQDISDWCGKLGESVVIMAIDEAVRNNVRSIKYIDGILANWHREDLKTVEEVRNHIRSWKERGSGRQNRTEILQNADAYRVIW